MGVTSDYESKPISHLVVKFCLKFLIFVVGVLVASAIFYGIEKNYPMGKDFIYPEEHYYENDTSEVLPKEEVEYLKNHSSFIMFVKDNNVSVGKMVAFLESVSLALNEHYEIEEKHYHEEAQGDDNDHHDGYHDAHHGYYDNGQYVETGDNVIGDEDYYNIMDHGMTFLEAFVLTLSLVSTIGEYFLKGDCYYYYLTIFRQCRKGSRRYYCRCKVGNISQVVVINIVDVDR